MVALDVKCFDCGRVIDTLYGESVHMVGRELDGRAVRAGICEECLQKERVQKGWVKKSRQ